MLPQMRIYPEREDTLVRCSELACARQDAAAIYPYGKTKRLAAFEGQNFTGQLRTSVKRDGSLGRKLGAYSVARNARRQGAGIIQLEGFAGISQRQRGQCENGINAAAA